MIDYLQEKSEQITILVADDDPSVIKLLTAYLKVADSSYNILSAPNGKIAIDIAKAKQPDLIITDWEMPVMSGLDTIQFLKMDEATKRYSNRDGIGKYLLPKFEDCAHCRCC